MHEEQNEDFVLKFQIMYDGSRVPIVCILFLYLGRKFWSKCLAVQIGIVIILESLKISEIEDT